MSIHSQHPFQTPEAERDPVRRFRGRMPAPVTVWTAVGAQVNGEVRVGQTVSSVMIALGEPGRVVALIDPDSDFWTAQPEAAVVNLLSAKHRQLADVFAAVAPAPGGMFTVGDWVTSQWGPVLVDSAGWLGVRFTPTAHELGYSVLAEAVIEQVQLPTDSSAVGQAMVHLRGRYRQLPTT